VELTRLLIIDDDRAILSSLEMVFQMEPGFLVSTLDDVRCWSKVVQEFRPDVILVDFKMPEMSGGEFIEALGKSGLRAAIRAVVLFSASPLGHDVARRLGADDFFLKPFSIDAVIQRIKKLAGCSAIL
jgi:DNA-binding response OmpR family regulator